MNKKRLIIIIVLMVAAAAAVILIVRSVLNKSLPNFISHTSEQTISPPSSTVVPQAINPEIKTWTGSLTLGPVVTLKIEDKIYTLRISGKETSSILQKQGYQSGDTVNALGRLVGGNVIDLSGLNKLVK